MNSLIDFGVHDETGDTYFRADQFCKYSHENMELRRSIRRQAVERAEWRNDGPIVPVIEYDSHFYARPPPRTVRDLQYDLVSGSSSSLSRASLSTLPTEGSGVTLSSRFSVLGSEAGYSETVDGDYSDFGEAYGIYRR